VGMGTDLSSSEVDWTTSFDVNVHAHRWAAKYLLPEWLAAGRGYFASTASAAGVLAQIGSAPYSVTKHAAVAFAEWLSITYGSRGITVSCLCPQGVNTAMLRGGDRPGIDSNAGNVVRAAGVVLEPSEVADIVHDAMVAERFFIYPHSEVADYVKVKANEHERWLGGMRKLQKRVFGI
jgi:NAD(P)-dependent dehydrogenase (short-subunit alcohol dehydrogenase family)